MQTIQQCFAVAVILNIYSMITSTRALSFSEEYKLKDGSVVIIDPKFVNGKSILSAICAVNEHSRASRPYLDCTVELTGLPFEDTQSTSKHCTMRLNREGETKKSYHVIPDQEFHSLMHIDDKKFILRWSAGYGNVDGGRKYHTEIYIAQIVDGDKCVVDKLLEFSGLSDKIYVPGDIMIHNEKIDIISSDIDKCHGRRSCKMTYDLNEKKLGRPYLYPTRLTDLSATPAVDSDGNYGSFNVEFDSNDEIYNKLVYVSSDGDETEIGRLPEAKFDYMPVSSAHGKFGICTQIDTSEDIQCYQYDGRKEKVLNKTISLRKSGTLLGVHNLREAGMLLFSSKCYSTGVNAQMKCKSFFVSEIYQDEEKIDPTFNIAKHDFVYDFQSQLNTVDISEDAGQYDFTVLESHNKTSESLFGLITGRYMGFDVKGGFLPKRKNQNYR